MKTITIIASLALALAASGCSFMLPNREFQMDGFKCSTEGGEIKVSDKAAEVWAKLLGPRIATAAEKDPMWRLLDNLSAQNPSTLNNERLILMQECKRFLSLF